MSLSLTRNPYLRWPGSRTPHSSSGLPLEWETGSLGVKVRARRTLGEDVDLGVPRRTSEDDP